MAGKWKYERLDQYNEKEEETVLIDRQSNHFDLSPNQFINTYPLNSFDPYNSNESTPFISSNHRNSSFNQINNFDHLDNEQYELKQRNNITTSQPQSIVIKEDSIELVEYVIKPTDSLLSIALSCNCNVEELKRVNKIINDQEFYALRTVRIPVRKYGLLSEVLIHQLNQTNKPISLKEIKESLSNHQLSQLNPTDENTQISRVSSSNNLLTIEPSAAEQQPLINFDQNHETNNHSVQTSVESNALSDSKSSSTNSLIVNVGLKKTFDFDRTNGDLNKFLVYLDKDLEKMRKLTKLDPTIIEPLDSNDLLLLNNSSKSDKNQLDCDDVYCGLTWKSVFFIAILICILMPLIYLAIYTEEQTINHHLNHH